MYGYRSNCRVAASILLFSLLAACGSNDTDVRRGEFKDSLVEGLVYKTATQSGVTDTSGAFSYKQGETVTFSLGGVVIGSAQGARLVTPVDLVPGATNENDETVTNVCRLLQSLDLDGNPDNGISIPATIRQTMANVSLDFSSPGFGNSPALSDLFRKLNDAGHFPQQRRLVSPDVARTHLGRSLRNEPAPPPQTPDRTALTLTDTPVYKSFHGGMAGALDSKNVPHIIIGGDHLYHFFRQADGWRSETIDVPGIAGGSLYSAKLFIDATDYLHCIFRDSSMRLNYVTNRPGYWSVEILNAAAAVVDSNGNLHMVSCNETGSEFTYGTNAGGRWATETFQAGAAAPSLSSLAVDALGKAHLVFCRTVTQGVEDTTLQYASNATGAWRVELLHEGYSISPTSVDVGVDHTGTPCVVYGYVEVIHGTKWCNGICDNMDQVDYFTKAGGQWVMAMADGRDSPDYVSLNVTRQGSVYLATGDSNYLSYRAQPGDEWVRKPLPAELGGAAAFAATLDSAGNLHGGYLVQGGLRYAMFADEEWRVENISLPKPSGEYPDITADAAGNLHISFWDASRQTLNYATNSHGLWTTEVVSNNVTINKPTTVSTDAQGKIHICYSDPTANKIMYAQKTGANWSIQTVGNNPFGRPSMAVDGAGNAHIIYFDWINWGLMYAVNSSGAWAVSRIVAVDWRGAEADLSVTADGQVYLCLEVGYLASNALAEGLWVISKKSGDDPWHFEKVYAGLMQNSYCAIAADETGDVHLVYRVAGQYGWDDQALYARKNTGWAKQLIAEGQIWKLSLALDAARNPYITYYDAANGVINYAYPIKSGWLAKQLAQLITYDYPDFLAPLTIDPTGHLSVAYFDYSTGDLKLVTISDPDRFVW